MLFHFNSRTLVHPPEHISAFIDDLIKRLIEEGHYYDGPDRRKEKRHAVALQVIAMPLTEDLLPAGPAFVATTRDISRNGIAIIHYQPVDSPLLAVQLTDLGGKTFEGAIDLRRCRKIGNYYEIAGQYVTKIYDVLNPGPGRAVAWKCAHAGSLPNRT
jgi:hypothetical protein